MKLTYKRIDRSLGQISYLDSANPFSKNGLQFLISLQIYLVIFPSWTQIRRKSSSAFKLAALTKRTTLSKSKYLRCAFTVPTTLTLRRYKKLRVNTFACLLGVETKQIWRKTFSKLRNWILKNKKRIKNKEKNKENLNDEKDKKKVKDKNESEKNQFPYNKQKILGLYWFD